MATNLKKYDWWQERFDNMDETLEDIYDESKNKEKRKVRKERKKYKDKCK